MNLNKGFTLIELLAVVVVVAAIALITTPIILNVLGSSKKGSVENSMIGYVSAIQKRAMLLDANEVDDDEIEGAIYTVAQLNGYKVSVKGDKPADTGIFIVNRKGLVIEGWATYHNGEYKVYYDGKHATVDKNNYLDKKGKKHNDIPSPGPLPEEESPLTVVYSAKDGGIEEPSEGVEDYNTLGKLAFIKYMFLDGDLTRTEVCGIIGNDTGRLFCVDPNGFIYHEEYANEFGASNCGLQKPYNGQEGRDYELNCYDTFIRSGVTYSTAVTVSPIYGYSGDPGANVIVNDDECSITSYGIECY